MDIDKRPILLWLTTIPFLVTIVIRIFLVYSRGNIAVIDPSFVNYILLAIFMLSVVAIFISGLKTKLKNWFGYGISSIFGLLVFYFVYDFNTCNGGWCDLDAFFLAAVSGLIGIVIASFYTISIYARRLNIKFILSVLVIEIILLILLIFFSKW
jgi:hypothetical protein